MQVSENVACLLTLLCFLKCESQSDLLIFSEETIKIINKHGLYEKSSTRYRVINTFQSSETDLVSGAHFLKKGKSNQPFKKLTLQLCKHCIVFIRIGREMVEIPDSCYKAHDLKQMLVGVVF